MKSKHIRYFEIAKQISTWSKDPSSKCGAVVVKNDSIISQGYNGFPRDIKDSPERLNNREQKYKYTVHSETNAIYNAVRNGQSLINATIYVYADALFVCSECAKAIIQSGIKEVYIQNSREMTEQEKDRWDQSCKLTKSLFDEAKIKFFHYIKDDFVFRGAY